MRRSVYRNDLPRQGLGLPAFRLPERDDDDTEPFHEWVREVGFRDFESGRDQTLEIVGVRRGGSDGGEDTPVLQVVQPGWWIVRHADSGFFGYPPDLFERLFS